LPDEWSPIDVTGIAVDSRDMVYVLNRSEHPVIIFDRSGVFLSSWGEGIFNYVHGIFIGPDDYVAKLSYYPNLYIAEHGGYSGFLS